MKVNGEFGRNHPCHILNVLSEHVNEKAEEKRRKLMIYLRATNRTCDL
jgi:hypothetical protein